MKSRASFVVLLMTTLALLCSASAQAAPLSTEQRRELLQIRRDLDRAAQLIRRERIDEAEKLVDEAEKSLKKIASDAGLQSNDRSMAPLLRTIAIRRKLLARAKGNSTDDSSQVSYSKDVAPILQQKCARCHGNNGRAGLTLTSHESLMEGSNNGPVVVAGNAQGSRLFARINATGNQLMPRGGPPLSAQEKQTIGVWISQGAKADSADEPENTTPVVIPKPTGDETVSFTKDIAPFMVNLCLRCHSGNDPNGGLSLETFEKIMQGGDSGRVIIPGNREGSRLFRLVGGLENPRMPQGQARITRQNYNDLIKWFDEGNKYDGENPRTPLRQLVPTEAELRAERFAKMTDEEFIALRKQRSKDQWDRAVPKEMMNVVESDDFLIYGNGPTERLQEIDGWAREHEKGLRKLSGEKDDHLWRGKLAIFVMDDRFSYEEFGITINNRRLPREVIGHSVVTPELEDAYIVLYDVGDEADSEQPGMKVNLIDHMTGAFLKRGGGNLPDWIVRGTGLALAAQVDPKNEYIRNLRTSVPEILRGVQRPDSIFRNGTFSPSDVGAVGYTLVEFLMKSGGAPKFGQFVARLQKGDAMNDVIRAVYRNDAASVARAYAASLGGR